VEEKRKMETNTFTQENTKFCKHCGAKIPAAAVICTHCGCQVEEIKKNEQPSIVINNANTNTNSNTNVNAPAYGTRMKNKWTAFLLCLFLGYLGAHKFYEGKAGMGILYLFTGGLFGIGWFIDCIVLLCKPNPYYVR
jgi:restriction system protein